MQKLSEIHTLRFNETESGYPIILPVKNIDLPKCFIGFNYVLSAKNTDCGVHFFIDDYMFERVFTNPGFYAEKLKKFPLVISPDFSCYDDFPKKIKEYNHFRRQWLGAYWQMLGINVIPDVQWSYESSYNFCFEGIPKESIVAVSSNGCVKRAENLKMFRNGWDKMFEVLNPSKVLLYGTKPDNLPFNDRIIQIEHRLKYMNERRSEARKNKSEVT